MIAAADATQAGHVRVCLNSQSHYLRLHRAAGSGVEAAQPTSSYSTALLAGQEVVLDDGKAPSQMHLLKQLL